MAAAPIFVTTTRRTTREDLVAIVESYTSTDMVRFANQVCAEVEDAVHDHDNYEEDELPPNRQAIDSLKALLKGVDLCKAPDYTVGTFYGELDLTWKKENRLLRVVTYSDDRTPLLYFYTDEGAPLPKGETVRPATITALRQKMDWLIG